MEIATLITLEELLNRPTPSKYDLELIGYLSKSPPRGVCASDLLSSCSELGSKYTTKQLAHFYKSEKRRVVEMVDGVEVIELLEGAPIMFTLKRKVCKKDCESCGVRERCVESEWND